MKKPYQKPSVLFENFRLTQQLANCNGVRISFDDAKCVFKDPDATPEMKSIAAQGAFNSDACAWRPNYQTNDGLCYFSNMHLVFSS